MRRYSRTGYSIKKIILAFVLIALMAVLSGYGLTKYIIKPLFLGMDEDPPQIENLSPESYEGSSIIIDNLQEVEGDDKEPGPEKLDNNKSDSWDVLYSIQYGSFSDMVGAETEASNLLASNIPVIVLEKDGAFKVVGQPYITKEEAANKLETIRSIMGEDPFITSVEVKMK